MNGYPVAYRSSARAYSGGPAFKGRPAGGSFIPSKRAVEQPKPVELLDQIIEAMIAENTQWKDLLTEAINQTMEAHKPAPSGAGGAPPQTPSSPLPGISKGAYLSAIRMAGRLAPFINYFMLARDLYQAAKWIYERLKLLNKTGPTGGGDCYNPCGSYDIITWSNYTICPYSACAFNSSAVIGRERPTPSDNAALYWYSHPHPVLPGRLVYDRNRVYIWPNASAIAGHPLFYGVPNQLPVQYPWLPQLKPIMKPVADPQPPPYRARPYLKGEYHQSGPDPRRDRQVVELPNPFGDGPASTPPYTTDHSPPPSGTRDKKYRDPKLIAAWVAIGAATEMDEMLECAWKALPPDKRRKVRGVKVAGQTMYWWSRSWAKRKGYTDAQIDAHNNALKKKPKVHQTPQNMIDDLMKNWEHLDRKKFETCVIESAAIDAVIGVSHQITRKGFEDFQKSAGLNPQWLHIGTGPAL